MQRLTVHHHFEDVFDIVAGELEPKPLPQTYDRFLARHGVDPRSAAMFEDLARNLEVPPRLGMTTVLVGAGAGDNADIFVTHHAPQLAPFLASAYLRDDR